MPLWLPLVWAIDDLSVQTRRLWRYDWRHSGEVNSSLGAADIKLTLI